MNQSVTDPYIITVVGMGVVMATLASLWFVARLVTLVVAFFEPPGVKSAPQFAAPLASAREEVAPAADQMTDEELIVILSAAATAVLGVPVRVVDFQPQQPLPILSNGWLQAARSEQLRSMQLGYGRK